MGVSDRSMDKCPSNAENEDEKRKIQNFFELLHRKIVSAATLFLHMIGNMRVNC